MLFLFVCFVSGPMMMHILDRQADKLLVDLSPCTAVCGGGGNEYSMEPASVRDRLMFLGIGSFHEGVSSSTMIGLFCFNFADVSELCFFVLF